MILCRTERCLRSARSQWCLLLEILDLIKDSQVVAATHAAEAELRRRRRVELHITEQRKLALHHLRLTKVPTTGAYGRNAPPQPPARQEVLGVDDLVRQLAAAAPSQILDDENHANKRADAFSTRGGMRGAKAMREAKLDGLGGYGHALRPGSAAPAMRGSRGGDALKVVDV